LDWFNDQEVCRFNSHHVFPMSAEDLLAYVRKVTQTRSSLVLAIAMAESRRHIGNVCLQSVDPVARSAEFAIVIGERDCWGQGYSKDAACLILRHGFESMNLHRIHCGTTADNEPMLRLARALGMREEGLRRQAAFKGGRYVDIVEFGILADEQRRLTGAD
jgi:ribosomal-protein-alanine N-acetyltransferase